MGQCVLHGMRVEVDVVNKGSDQPTAIAPPLAPNGTEEQTFLSSMREGNCPICLEDHKTLAVLACGHGMCVKCLVSMMLLNQAHREFTLCPICKKQITKIHPSDAKQVKYYPQGEDDLPGPRAKGKRAAAEHREGRDFWHVRKGCA